MGWRFQIVWGEDRLGEHSDKWYSLCEVYFDKAGKLESWTADPSIRPIGNDPGDLRKELVRMLVDAHKWRPVKFSELRVGMTFERAVAQEKAD